jgi:hypothetical protein
MPLDEKILGFSNRWYRAAMQAADAYMLAPSLRIRIVTPPYFVATKLEAFKGRGEGDYFNSRDLEDIVSVVDGRPSLVDELRTAPQDLKAHVAAEIKKLLQDQRFIDALPGYVLPDAISQERIGILLHRLKDLSRC